MTQQEKIDKAMDVIVEAVPASLGIAILAILFVLFFATEVFGEQTIKFTLAVIVVIEAVVLLFLAAFGFYLRVYLPLQGVA